MKPLSAHIKETLRYMALMAAAFGMGACDTVLDNGDEDCDVRVRFIYEHNMLGVDAFHKQVSAVTLYIFDADSTLVHQQSETGAALADPNYRMRLPFDPKGHHLIAWAHHEGCTTTQLTQLNTGESCMKELACRIGGRTPKPDGCTEVCEIGPIFHGQVDNPVAVKKNGAAPTITIPLVKNTSTLRIILQNTSDKPLDADDFTYTVVEDNGLMAYDNALMPDDTLTYVPFVTQDGTAGYDNSEGQGVKGEESRASSSANINMAIAEFTLGRLMADKNPRLTVTNRTTGETVFSIPLVDYLKLMRSQHETGNMSDQEYLDREDTYAFTFFLDDDANWISASILINSWRVVLQEVDL